MRAAGSRVAAILALSAMAATPGADASAAAAAAAVPVVLRRTVRFLDRPRATGHDRQWRLELGADKTDHTGERLARVVRNIQARLHETFVPPTQGAGQRARACVCTPPRSHHLIHTGPRECPSRWDARPELTAPPFVIERDGYASFDLNLIFSLYGEREPAHLFYDMDVSSEGTHVSTHKLVRPPGQGAAHRARARR